MAQRRRHLTIPLSYNQPAHMHLDHHRLSICRANLNTWLFENGFIFPAPNRKHLFRRYSHRSVKLANLDCKTSRASGFLTYTHRPCIAYAGSFLLLYSCPYRFYSFSPPRHKKANLYLSSFCYSRLHRHPFDYN